MTTGASFSPDSSSSAADSRGLTPTPRSTENTAAASVLDSTAPHSSDVRQSKPISRCTPRPATAIDTTTETVASEMPKPSAGRTFSHRVVRPPSARMKTSATKPELLGEQRVVQVDDAEAVDAEHHADAQVQQQRRHAEPAGQPNGDQGEQQDQGRDAEGTLWSVQVEVHVSDGARASCPAQ